MTTSPASYSRGGSSRAAAAGVLIFPWCIHLGVVGASLCSLRLLSSQLACLVLVTVAVTVSVGVSVRAARVPGPDSAAPPVPGASRFLSAGVTAAGVLVLGWALLAALAFPIVAYDALGYRLPAIADWLNLGRVAWVQTDDAVRNGYPLGQEAFTAVLTVATGSFRFAAATSFPYVAGGALALVGLAEDLGVRPGLARVAGALFVLAPMVTLNASSGYVDAAFAGALVALIAFATGLGPSRDRVTRGDARVWILGTGLAASHVLSLKGNGVVFAGLVFVVVLARAALFRVWKHRAALHTWASGLGLAIVFALPGAFWVVRNVVVAKNPFWPVRMHLGPITLPGTATLEQVLDLAHNTPPELAAHGGLVRVLRAWLELSGPATDFDARLAGMGLAWILVALPAVVWVLLGRGVAAEAPGRQQLRFVTATTALCFAIQPMNWWARYTLWLWGAGALAVVLALEVLLRGDNPRAAALVLAVVAVLTVSEGAFAAAHANGAHTALAQHGPSAFFGRPDPRRPRNVSRWIDSRFWALGLEDEPTVCRGYWKPGTDDANLDGVFAQLEPRPRVVAIQDEKTPWPTVRRAAEAAGCRRLMLFARSPVLPAARRDPDVDVEEIVAFDPLFLVTPRSPRVSFTSSSP